MANIRVDSPVAVYSGLTLTFKSPADCSQVTGLSVYYRQNDQEVKTEFQFADAHGNNVGDLDLFAANVVVKVILDTVHNRAYVQNADTNAYLESRLNSKVDAVQRESGTIISIEHSGDMPLHGLKLFGKTTQLTTTGKNLFDKNGVNFISGYIIDGVFTTGSSSAYTAFYMPCTPNTTYTVSRKAVGSTERLLLGWTEDVPKDGSSVNNTDTPAITGVTVGAIISKTVTTGATAKYLVCYLGWTNRAQEAETCQLEIGTKATAYEPYTGGIPVPNPDYPQELVSAGASGAIKTKVVGGNIFDPTRLSGWNTTCEISEDGYTITMEGKEAYARATYVEKFWLAGQTLYFEMDSATSSNANVVPLAQIEITCPSTSSRISIDPNNPKAVVSIPTDAEDVHIKLYTNQTSTTLSENVKIIYKGVRFTFAEGVKWEPYKAPQTLTVSTPNGLPGIPVSSGGNYTDANGQQWVCDEIDFARGVYVKRTDKIDMETLNWGVKEAGLFYSWGLRDVMGSGILCDRYVVGSLYEVYDKHTKDKAICFNDVGSYFIGLSDSDYTDGNSLKASLSGATLMYVLATPIETALSAEELAQYAVLHTHKPNTTVYNDAGAYMNVAYFTSSSALPVSGGRMGGNIDMAGNSVTNLATPVNAGDAVPLGYLDSYWSDNYVPTTRTVNGKPLSADVSLGASDVGAAPSGYGYGEGLVGIGNANDDTAFTAALSEQFAKTANKTRQFYFTYGGGAYLGKLWNAGNNYGVLVATSYAEPNVGYRFKQMVRVCKNGVWDGWVDTSPTSFAPAGYGLGGLCVNITDWDNATKNGFYYASTNSPDGDRWWGFVIANSENYIEQRVFRTSGGTLAERHRSRYNGDWQSWVDCSPSAFAPAGYGYGEARHLIWWDDSDGTKLENYLDGFFTDINNRDKIYRFTIVDYPACVVAGQGGYADIVCTDMTGGTPQSITIVYYAVDSSDRGMAIATKKKHSGVWKPWEYVNPPMTPDVEYRTTERINGKAVYKKADSAGRIKYRLDGETEWKPLLSTSDLILTENVDYGAELPAAGTKGRLFFKVVE